MFLGHPLHRAGSDTIILERKTRAYVEGRVRAGVLEQGIVALMRKLDLATRLNAKGLVHTGINLAYDGEMFQINMAELTGGATVTVYGQQEVMRDLFDAAEARGIKIEFEAKNLPFYDIAGPRPGVTYEKPGFGHRIDCDFLPGCDGAHGISRLAIPASACQLFERVYLFGWLRILADVPRLNPELIYASHARGFALASMRSAARSRYYIQCPIDERVDEWPDERFWDKLCLRLGPAVSKNLVPGPSFEKNHRAFA
jgi:p-hydroxybenzoate 3-monooxygenase